VTGTTPRQQLAAQVAADNSEWIVKPYPFEPKQVRAGKPVVSIWRGEISPASSRTMITHELTLHVYGSKVADEGAENELDNILDQIMLSIERYKGCAWSSAKRRNFVNDTFAGFEITATVTSANVYRSTIKEEETP
jgi:hypothetical protein